jgi:ribonuclease HII
MTKPDFSHEKDLWQKGYRFVIGVDEVGRGAFAGPVVAAAAAVSSIKKADIPNTKYVILDTIFSLGINDSKKLSAKKRESLEKEIKKYFYYGIGEVSVGFINSYGLTKATEKAMRQAVVRLMYQIRNGISNAINSPRGCANALSRGGGSITKDFIEKIKPYLLLDTFHVKYVPVVGLSHQKAVPSGDQKSISIAAASILAKVYRDNFMVKLSSQHPKYHWEKNKGYGSREHRETIAQFGITKHHRKKFVEKWVTKEVGR